MVLLRAAGAVYFLADLLVAAAPVVVLARRVTIAGPSFIDVADELLFERVLDRVEREVACVVAHLREGLPTDTCADPLPQYEPPFGQEANAALAPLEPLKRPKNDDPTLKEAVDALKKGENVRIPGLLDERIEECGPNRNCYAAVKRERNASKPPLEEFLSRFLGQK